MTVHVDNDWDRSCLIAALAKYALEAADPSQASRLLAELGVTHADDLIADIRLGVPLHALTLADVTA